MFASAHFSTTSAVTTPQASQGAPRRGGLLSGATIIKLLLVGGVVIVSVVFMWYNYTVVRQLRAEAKEKVRSYVRLWVRAVDQSTPSAETQLIFDEIISRADFPIVVASAEREPNFWRTLPGVPDNDPAPEIIARVKELMAIMRKENGETVIQFGSVDDSTGGQSAAGLNYFYYGDSALIASLEMAPYIQIAVVVAFLGVGLVGLTSIKRSDERSIWVGMAKETAHQLGTPISSLMGWLELMKEKGSATTEAPVFTDADIVEGMGADVDRLQHVANRFGLIGSAPGRQEGDINEIAAQTVEYFRKRLPFRGQGIAINFEPGDIPPAQINAELVGWAIENLIRNAMQAVDSRAGRIVVRTQVAPDRRAVRLEVQDNGKGVPLVLQRKIFRPGVTSKKRGWGLGLTLSKRIVEEYHGGKLQLVRSAPGETIFALILPVGRRKL